MGFELTVKVVLKKDMHFTESLQEIGKSLSESFNRDVVLSALHNARGYKNYVFSNFSNTERDGIYRAGRVYKFNVRSFDRDLLTRMRNCLYDFESFGVIFINSKITEYSGVERGLVIEKLRTRNPIVLDGVAKSLDDFNLIEFKNRIESNIEKKYNEFFDESFRGHSWINRIEVLSNRPVALKYKGIKLLGMNYVIYVNDDGLSQRMADFASFVGLGEKNSVLGAGFSNAEMYEIVDK